MPTKVGWLIPDRVIYSQSIGSIDEYIVKEHAAYLLDLLNASNQEDVYLIFDTLHTTSFKVNLAVLNQATSLYLNHPSVVHSIDITRHIKNQMLGNVIASLAEIKWRHFQTLEDGLSYLSECDESLDTLDISSIQQFLAKGTIASFTSP